MTEKIIETDVGEKQEEVVISNKVEIGTFNNHLAALKRGMEEYGIWSDINTALVAMAHPNISHRVDLSDQDFLDRIEKESGLKIDRDFIKQQIESNRWLIQPNGFKENIHNESNVNDSSKKITKKQMAINNKKDKLQVKIEKLKTKHSSIKNKKCDRAVKLMAEITELEKAKDRL